MNFTFWAFEGCSQWAGLTWYLLGSATQRNLKRTSPCFDKLEQKANISRMQKLGIQENILLHMCFHPGVMWISYSSTELFRDLTSFQLLYLRRVQGK